ncbi:hypothetical protein LPJ66_000508 [Kickxella alabastrina]|uniref:Uncharacterized protein n=1 Tax=Kickxella alabastrina TaxID=61397 RepID=A0ACC1IVQ4_9FUNG|nr:hypothetical protein LPJ66_000508 [Kickxella alabastrina]
MVSGPSDSDSHTQTADITAATVPNPPSQNKNLKSIPAALTLPIASSDKASQAGMPTPPPSARIPAPATGGVTGSSSVRPRPSAPQTAASGNSQLLRKINVAGVTVEVVRQDSTIIYRLPGNMPVSSLTPEQRTKVMDEIQRMRNTTVSSVTRTPVQPVQPGVRSQSALANTLGSGSIPPPRLASIALPPRPKLQQQQPRANTPQTSAAIRPVGGTAQARTPSIPGPKPIAAASSDASRLVRPHPVLPNIAPRSVSGSGLPPSFPSTPLLAPLTRPPQHQQQQQQSRIAGTAHPFRRPSLAASPSPAAVTPQRSALEKMYQSAYLKLLSGPQEILRKLSPPIELNKIVNKGMDEVISPAMLLQILKALTKSQASQLAGMYEQDLKLGKGPLDINTGGGSSSVQSSSPMGSLPSSREASPNAESGSAYELDGAQDTPNSGTATPTLKRKYNKTGKYSTKKRSSLMLEDSEPPSPMPASPQHMKLPRLPQNLQHSQPSQQQPRRPQVQPPVAAAVFSHPDLNRKLPKPMAERRKCPAQFKHEADISKRFRDALSMDHQMVDSPDWRTPFAGTRDVIQRLLPFHVFQYPDSVAEAGIAREERRISKSAVGLGEKLQSLAERYNALLASEGSETYYSMDCIQLDMRRMEDTREQIGLLREAQLQRDISSLGAAVPKPTTNTSITGSGGGGGIGGDSVSK